MIVDSITTSPVKDRLNSSSILEKLAINSDNPNENMIQ